MTDLEKIAFKEKLRSQCIALIEERMLLAAEAMQQAQDAANAEEKSSAGDKYETGRAMNHIQKDLHARQLAENRKELEALLAIDCSQVRTTAGAGAIVIAGDFRFFIAAGLGALTLEGEKILAISPQAPLARLLYNKKTADTILFNQQEKLITDVF